MKYIKRFENIQETPQVGDYVLINIDISYRDDIMNFVNNTIGKIIYAPKEITDIWGHKSTSNVSVIYEDKDNQNAIPKNIKNWFTPTHSGYVRGFSPDKIVVFGKTKEEVEQKALSKKFNI